MSLPPKPFLRLDEVCRRWGVTEDDIADHAFANTLVLSARVMGVRVEVGVYEELNDGVLERIPDGFETLIGTPDLHVRDAWAALKTGQARVFAFRLGDVDRYMVPVDGDGVQVLAEDLVVRLEEVERFDRKGRPSATLAVVPGPRQPRGKPARYDWDAFWVEVCRRVHEEGLPDTQGALVRHMLDWFAETGRDVPDDSTVKKKIAPLWRALAISADQRSA